MITVLISQMVITMDLEGMRNGIGEIVGQTIIIIIGIMQDIMQDIWDMMIGIDGGMEMEGKKIFIQRETTAKNGRRRGRGEF